MQISSFTEVAFTNLELPKVTGSSKLSPHHALSLINCCSGILLGKESCRLSLPFTCEKDERGFHLRSHFPVSRAELTEQIEKDVTLEVLFDTGEYYIDPEWILRERAHAPIEVKAVFSVLGPARFIEVSQKEAIDHLDLVRAYKQIRFNPNSKFEVNNLPAEYLSEMLPQILHFEIDVERIEVSQVMALTHLSVENRTHILNQLDRLGDPKAQEAAQIMRFFL